MTATSTRAKEPLRFRPIDAVGIPFAAVTAIMLCTLGTNAVVAVVLGCFALVAPVLARYDWTERRLPNAITLPLILLGGVAATVNAISGDFSVLAALAVGGVLFVMAVAGGMGMGDVKLGLALALAASGLGWGVAVAGFVVAVLLGGLVALLALIFRRRSLAFGPWLIAGYALAIAGSRLGGAPGA